MHHLSLLIAKIITFKSTWMITTSIFQVFAMQADANGMSLQPICKPDFTKMLLWLKNALATSKSTIRLTTELNQSHGGLQS